MTIPQDPVYLERIKDLAWFIGWFEGVLEGLRSSLLERLAARSLPITDDVRARIDEECWIPQLKSWIRAAVTAETLEDVFASE